MSYSKKEKYTGALIGAAIGDALGWPNEQNSKNISKNKNSIRTYVEWNRRAGGRYWPHEEKICVGEYSDDTQLIIATARSLLRGRQWSNFFRQAELPAWLKYERGGGGATKRAAQKWADNISPWDEKSNSPLEIKDYFMAGGNGVAMRIIPHIFKNEENIEKIMAQVVLNGMYTHGHPRALIGAMLYAMAVRTLIQQDANLNNADTDTLASMVGGLVGALNGKDWIPIELRGVQDYSLFEYLIEQMMDEKCDFLNSDKQYQLFNNEKMATLEIGDSIECLPFGEITLKEIREDKPKRAGMYVKVYVWKTAYGQTIFSKKIGKKTLNMEQTIPHTVEKKHSPEIQFTVQKLKDIKKLLIKVSDAADFVEILSEIVQMKIDDDISKEKIDEMKVKWKPYKITKKQIVSIYELL